MSDHLTVDVDDSNHSFPWIMDASLILNSQIVRAGGGSAGKRNEGRPRRVRTEAGRRS